MHTKLEVPLNALLLSACSVVVLGCIFLGSDSAFNAITSAAVVALGVSYAAPVTINLIRGRRMLPKDRLFKLPVWFAWIANIVGVAYVMVTTVLFLFPPTTKVTGSSMNYCVVAFGIVLIICITQWFIDGRRNYHGPKIMTATNGLAGADALPDEPSSGFRCQDKETALDGACVHEEYAKE